MYIFQLSLIATDWKILQDMLCIYIWPYAILKKKTPQNNKQKNPQQKPKHNPKQPLESNKPKPTPLKAQKSLY